MPVRAPFHEPAPGRPRRRERVALPSLPEFSPAGDEPVEAQLYAHLRQALMAGALAPGQRITSRALADACGISATPTRMALHQLAAEGVLTRRERSAYQVAPATADAYAELLQIRLRLEGLAARAAAGRMQPATLAALRAVQARIAGQAESSPAYLALNFEFHFIIYREAAMPHLLDMISQAWMRIGPCLSYVGDVLHLRDLDAPHERIIAALAAGDGAAAEAALRADLEGAAAALLPRIRVESAMRDRSPAARG